MDAAVNDETREIHLFDFRKPDQIENFLYKNELARDLLEQLKTHHEESYHHLLNVGLIASMVADNLGLPPDEKESVILAAALHDVGKLGVPNGVLTKTEKLDDADWQAIQTHPDSGFKLLENFSDPIAKWVALNHHRLQKSRSYPSGEFGTNTDHIPNDLTPAQMKTFRTALDIVVASDMAEAIIGNRAYQLKEGMTPQQLAAAETDRATATWNTYSGFRKYWVIARTTAQNLRRAQQPTPEPAPPPRRK